MAAQRPKPELTAQQERMVRMEANGLSSPDIIKELWGLEKGDPGYHSYECRLTRWRKHPKYEEIWKDEVRRNCFGDYVKAQKTLRKSVDSKDEWLAMQSAVNVIGNAGKRVFGNEDNSVTVQVSGMPELGSPDQDE